MAPGFASEVVKDNSNYLTKLNSNLLLALIVSVKIKSLIILYF